MAYTVPQIKVFQEFSFIPTAVVDNQNAFVFGQNYHLFRYSEADEKALIALDTQYTGEALSFDAWPNQPSSSEVDIGYAKLFMDKARLQYGVFGSLAKASGGVLKRVRSTDDILKTGNGGTVDAALPANGVRVGHYAKLQKGAEDFVYRRIVGIEADVEGAAVGPTSTVFTAEVMAVGAGSDLGDISQAGNGSATIRVTSSSDGAYVQRAVTFATLADAIGTLHGITFTLGAGAVFSVGNKATVTAALGAGVTTWANTSGATLKGALDGASSTGVYAEIWDGGTTYAATEVKVAAPTGTFTGTRATTFIFEVLVGGVLTDVAGTARVRVRSTADGRSVVSTITGANREITGSLYGLTFAAASTNPLTLVTGESVTISATPGTLADYRTLVFSEELPDAWDDGDDIDVYLQAEYSGIEIPRANAFDDTVINWSASAETIDIEAGLTVNHPDMITAAGLDIVCTIDTSAYDAEEDVYTGADLFMEYRALRLDNSDIGVIEKLTDTEDAVGKAHPDNPLGLAAYIARLNSGSRPVYYTAVNGTDSADWSEVLARAAVNSKLYAFAPASSNEIVQELVKAHILSMSNEEDKKWRIAFFGMGDLAIEALYTKGTNPDGEDYLADITNDTLTFNDASALGIAAEDDVSVGDEVRFNFIENAVTGEIEYDSLTVTDVLSDSRLKLSDALDTPLTGTRVEVYHNRTVNERKDAVVAKSLAFHSRRVYNCFGGNAITTDGYAVTSEYIGAAVAGLCSSVVPQQGLTHIELAGFSSLPNMFQVYTPSQLNAMAEAGTLIVAQDFRGGPIYIRHQLSTAFIDGNLNTSELSLVKNMDSVSHLFATRLAPFSGLKNITPDTLAKVNVIAKDTLDYLMSNTDVGDSGPQLLGEETKINSIFQDAVLKDTVFMDIDLEFPKPFNTLNLTLRAV
jgi:hypothetical protein